MDRPAGERRPFAGSTVLLGVGGGIAAFKAVTVARDLARAGAAVEVVLSAGALEFIRPLSFAALTGRRAHVEAYRPDDPLLHIRLAREADLVLVAPATANAVARAAAGMADDLLTAVLLATRAPVVFCPAMNDRMYEHPQTQANLHRLAEIGYRVVEAATGALAWGEGEGPGRLPEPGEILDHAARALSGGGALAGRRVVVTAGPTREPIDPVRYLGNRSSGRMGYATAAAAWRRGSDVLLISGPSTLAPPTGVELERVETAEQMRSAVARALPSADVLVMAAAVADFRPCDPAASKLKKAENGVPELALEKTPDVLTDTLPVRPAGLLVVGFALETEDAVAKATCKLEAKKLDLLVVNDATEEGAGFEVPTNRVTLVSPDRPDEELPLLAKEEVAERILDRVEPLLAAAGEPR